MSTAATSSAPANRPRRAKNKSLRAFLRNRLAVAGMVTLVTLFVFSFVGPLAWPRSPERIDLANRTASPSWSHPLGTDEHGRDIVARLMHGGRVSLTVGLTAALISVTIGGALGVLSGFLGGRVDVLIMRVTDAFMSIPLYFLLLTVLAVIGGGVRNVIIVIGLTSWMPVARVVRSEVLRVRALEFVTATRALGTRDLRIMLAHVAPQTTGLIIVGSTLNVAFAILVESSLSYLGLGVQPPAPSWGNMLQDSRSYMFTAPQLAMYPGLGILLTVLAINAVGDGLRDAFDPRRGL